MTAPPSATALPEGTTPLAATAPTPWYRQRRVRLGALAVLLLALVGAAVWWVRFRPYVSTDDARIAMTLVQVSPTQGGGRVARVAVDVGDAVRAGDVLVELDRAPAEAALAHAQAALDAAVAREEVAEVSLELERTVESSDLDRAHAALSAARSSAATARATLERTQAMLTAGGATRADLDRATAAADAADAQERDASARLAEVLAGSHSGPGGETARVQVKEAELAAARAAVEQAQADLRSARLALADAELTTPLAGVVVQRTIDPGDQLEHGQTGVTVADTAHAWVDANVEETSVGWVEPGQPVTIRVDEGGTLTGHVLTVGRSAASVFALIPSESASGNYTKVVQRIPIRVELDDPTALPLRAGQSVELRVRVRP